MKPIRYTKQFQKSLRSRFGHKPKVLKQFRDRTELFVQGERGYPLDDHHLTGNMNGYQAYSVAGDVRVVYKETDEEFEFHDIGTHNQVYK